MQACVKHRGRPYLISDRQIEGLRTWLSANPLASTRDVQARLSNKVLGYTSAEAVSLQTTRTCIRRAGFALLPKRTELSMPKHRIKELKNCIPAMKQFVAPVLEVARGVPIREAARKAGVDQRTLRDRFCRARDRGLKGIALPHEDFMKAFVAWCDKVKTPTAEKAAANFRGSLHKSPRTWHRYIMQWQDLRAIPRRHWSCGGSKWA